MATRSKKNENKNIPLVKRNVFVKKVILENFLSFQKDEVEFGDSKFNLIIGPNWSGKTSIFQAIKFGLGSNERDERYHKWSDFIRTGQQHAMVEIHLENAIKSFKLRRTVIKGQSPFFEIRKTGDADFKKVPAIEVQRLIEDLGINPDNHFAIVSQGKIDTIKNLKPVELCSFLEEGIGLRGLRIEILQQKKSVENLNRELNSLSTKKNTLNINLELLRPKLERLEQKKQLLKKREKFHDELLWANRKKLQKEIEKLEEEIVKVRVNVDILSHENKKYDKEIEEIQGKISEIELKVNQLSEKLGELNYKKQDLIKRIQNWQKDKIKAKQELDDLAIRIKKEEKDLKNVEGQKKTLKSENTEIKKEKSKFDKKFDDLLKEQEELTKKIDKNEEFLKKYNHLGIEKKEKLKKIQEHEKLIKDYNLEITQLFQSFKDIDHKLETNKWFLENPSKDLLKQLDIDLKKTSDKIYSLEAQVDQAERERAKKLRKIKPLQASLRERKVILPTNITILKDEIQKRDLGVKGPIIEFLKYDDTLSYAIESVLGEKLLYSFVADNWDTLDLLKRLKNKFNAYCNIYVPKKNKVSPLMKITASGVIGYLSELIKVTDDDPDIKKVIYSKVKNCLVVRDYRSGKELYKNFDFKGKCVTLKGEQIISYKYVYETPFMKQLKGFLSTGTQKEQSARLESEIKTLNENISNLRVELSKLDEIQKEIYRKKESFNDLLYNFNQKQRLTTKKNQLYEKIYALENDISAIRKEIKVLDDEIEVLKSQRDPEFFEWNDRLKKIPEELTLVNSEKRKWEEKLQESSNYLKEIEDKLKNHEIKLENSKKEHEKKKEAFQTADRKAFKIYEELETIEDEIDENNSEISSSADQKQVLQAEKGELDKKNIQLRIELEHETIKLNAAKIELELKKKDLERINSQIGTKKDFVLRPIEEINADIAKMDKELIRFLDVDESIVVEWDQIMAGLKEIDKNQRDLETDVKAAIKTERELENTYYDKFKIVLEDLKSKINFKFKSSQVKSYCSLELMGDFEELGVDIKAGTSKTDLRSCSALSGGQVSMVSICLILSLQEIKPSPLCMFDEAGMFLDDKNSEISYQLIKTTLEQNPIQMIMFLPKSSNSLYSLAEKLIGVARVGKQEVSTIFKPKIVKKANK